MRARRRITEKSVLSHSISEGWRKRSRIRLGGKLYENPVSTGGRNQRGRASKSNRPQGDRKRRRGAIVNEKLYEAPFRVGCLGGGSPVMKGSPKKKTQPRFKKKTLEVPVTYKTLSPA